MPLRKLAVGMVAFAAMEPVTYLTHRFVMHGIGAAFHRSHHVPQARRLEANDAYPAIFASGVLITMWAAYHHRSLRGLLPVTVGISAYGTSYALVHDGYIHGRLPALPANRAMDHLATSHRLHHRFNGEPYGMLAPVVPAALRARAASVPTPEREPITTTP